MPGRVKVLYIMGWGRSGSTILDNILGELDGLFSMGELHYFWERSVIGGRSCGCGRPVTECEIWSKVLAAMGPVDAAQVLAWQNESVRVRQTRSLLRNRGATEGALGSYAEVTSQLYAAARDATGARVLIDSSKRPSDAALLELLPNIDPVYLHLVRDPRAVAFSWKRKKAQRDTAAPAEMLTHGTADNAANWTLWNLGANAVRRSAGRSRSMLVRYEDFVARPREITASVVRLAGAASALLPFSDAHTVELAPNHTVSGNPSRFTTGSVRIEPDEDWITAQSSVDRWTTTALTLPLLPRYGYPILPRAASASS